ncbi:ankyrin repeat-containing protein [Anaeramoeba flamelloides]|uniref:Ankyrin repeat-containing protein n=1 Tax=Anaeramoeba flamelloides TaxID=1746091 RepID=A0AAV7Z5M9_9EUKA|nr:ankyrin repeat-containing protein [Anaeramoeba flamelloides]
MDYLSKKEIKTLKIKEIDEIRKSFSQKRLQLTDRLFRTSLHLVSRNLKVKVGYFRYLVSKGVDPLALDDGNKTILHHYIKNCNCNLNCFEYLVSLGIDVNQRDSNGKTVLRCVCKRGSKYSDILELLLKKGAKPNYRDSWNRVCIHWLCWRADSTPKDINLLVDYGADLAKGNELGDPVLHQICKEPHPNSLVIELLLSKGSTLTLLNKFHQSILHLACDNEKVGLDLIKKMICKGNINKTDVYGKSAFQYLLDLPNSQEKSEKLYHFVSNKHFLVETTKTISRSQNWYHVLANHHSNVKLLRMFISRGAKPNPNNLKEDKALHIIFKSDQLPSLETVQYLLSLKGENKISVNDLNMQNQTVLYLACKSSLIKPQIIELLLKKNETINYRCGSRKESALCRYCKSKDPQLEVIRILIESGADPLLLDFRSWSPLYYLFYRTNINPDPINYMLANGSQIYNKQTNLYSPILAFFKTFPRGYPENFVKICEKHQFPLERVFTNDNKNLLQYYSCRIYMNFEFLKWLFKNGTNNSKEIENASLVFQNYLHYGELDYNIIKWFLNFDINLNELRSDSKNISLFSYICSNRSINEKIMELCINSIERQREREKKNNKGGTLKGMQTETRTGGNFFNANDINVSPIFFMCKNISQTLPMIKMLVKYENKKTLAPLLRYPLSISNPNHQIIGYLIQSGSNVNYKEDNSNTPLHYLAKNNNISIKLLDILLSNGAMINSLNSSNETPLFFYLRTGNVQSEIINWFILNGAKIDIRDIYGNSPLLLLCLSKKIEKEIFTLFLNNNANTLIVNNKHLTPLHLLVGLNANNQDIQNFNMGFLVLHQKYISNINIIKLFIKGGCDINQKEKKWGKTPLNVITTIFANLELQRKLNWKVFN